MAERILTQPVPNLSSPIVSINIKLNGKNIEGKGFLISPWNSFFQQFVQTAPQPIEIELETSPFIISPGANGSITLVGGTITSVTLIRGTVSMILGSIRLIPIRIGDSIEVTYTGTPTIRFLPD